MSELRDWLEKQNLQELAEILEKHDIDLDVLSELTEEDLISMGISIGFRRRLLKAILAQFGSSRQSLAPRDISQGVSQRSDDEIRQTLRSGRLLTVVVIKTNKPVIGDIHNANMPAGAIQLTDQGFALERSCTLWGGTRVYADPLHYIACFGIEKAQLNGVFAALNFSFDVERIFGEAMVCVVGIHVGRLVLPVDFSSAINSPEFKALVSVALSIAVDGDAKFSIKASKEASDAAKSVYHVESEGVVQVPSGSGIEEVYRISRRVIELNKSQRIPETIVPSVIQPMEKISRMGEARGIQSPMSLPPSQSGGGHVVIKHRTGGCLGCLVIVLLIVLLVPVLAFVFKVSFLLAILDRFR